MSRYEAIFKDLGFTGSYLKSLSKRAEAVAAEQNPATPKAFRVGDRIEAVYKKDDRWYGGQITGVGDKNTYDVLWDDSGVAKSKPGSEIRQEPTASDDYIGARTIGKVPYLFSKKNAQSKKVARERTVAARAARNAEKDRYAANVSQSKQRRQSEDAAEFASDPFVAESRAVNRVQDLENLDDKRQAADREGFKALKLSRSFGYKNGAKANELNQLTADRNTADLKQYKEEMDALKASRTYVRLELDKEATSRKTEDRDRFQLDRDERNSMLRDVDTVAELTATRKTQDRNNFNTSRAERNTVLLKNVDLGAKLAAARVESEKLKFLQLKQQRNSERIQGAIARVADQRKVLEKARADAERAARVASSADPNYLASLNTRRKSVDQEAFDNLRAERVARRDSYNGIDDATATRNAAEKQKWLDRRAALKSNRGETTGEVLADLTSGLSAAARAETTQAREQRTAQRDSVDQVADLNQQALKDVRQDIEKLQDDRYPDGRVTTTQELTQVESARGENTQAGFDAARAALVEAQNARDSLAQIEVRRRAALATQRDEERAKRPAYVDGLDRLEQRRAEQQMKVFAETMAARKAEAQDPQLLEQLTQGRRSSDKEAMDQSRAVRRKRRRVSVEETNAQRFAAQKKANDERIATRRRKARSRSLSDLLTARRSSDCTQAAAARQRRRTANDEVVSRQLAALKANANACKAQFAAALEARRAQPRRQSVLDICAQRKVQDRSRFNASRQARRDALAGVAG